MPFPAPAPHSRIALEEVTQLHGQGPNKSPLRELASTEIGHPSTCPHQPALLLAPRSTFQTSPGPTSPQPGTLTGSLSRDDFASYFAEKIEAIRKGRPHLPATPPTSSAHWHCPSSTCLGLILPPGPRFHPTPTSLSPCPNKEHTPSALHVLAPAVGTLLSALKLDHIPPFRKKKKKERKS